MRKQHRSPLMASIHETVEGLHLGVAMDKRTMREFDELCLTPCKHRLGESVGTRREAAPRPFLKAANACSEKRPPGRRLISESHRERVNESSQAVDTFVQTPHTPRKDDDKIVSHEQASATDGACCRSAPASRFTGRQRLRSNQTRFH